MLKNLFTLTTAIVLLASCSSLKQASQKNPPAPNTTQNSNDPRFLDDISVTQPKTEVDNKTPVRKSAGPSVAVKEDLHHAYIAPEIESASALQLKYAVLLDTEVEEVRNLRMFEYIDQWIGTRYCMGGTTKSCIDCSAFVQTLFTAMYGVTLPRTAREQYRSSKRISRTELKEGDLLFFNTTGGVSHVGVYLQNNKFVHASSSDGVTISDVFDPYWVRKFVGVGRVASQESLVDSQ